MSGSIDLIKTDFRATIVLNNPQKRNAISAQMWEQLQYHAEKLADDSDLRAVVIRGFGETAFAAGADISQFESKRIASADGSTYDKLTEAALESIKKIPVPVIALIQGYCIGAGISLAIACDLRYASISAKFAIPAARLGTAYPAPALRRLVALVGASNAKLLLFTAKRVDATTALAMRLVDGIFDNQQVEQETISLINSIGENAPLTLRASKFAIDEFVGIDQNIDEDTIYSLARQCFESEDYKEGVKAFMESRQPNFKGK